jgi:hypothetical protein
VIHSLKGIKHVLDERKYNKRVYADKILTVKLEFEFIE